MRLDTSATMSTAQPNSLETAERAHALVQSHPRKAVILAQRAVELARSHGDPDGLVAGLHALGYARYTLGDERALATIRVAVRTAERNGLDRRAAMARRHCALYLAYRGRFRSALREIDRARAALTGLDRARSEVFRIAIYEMAGRAEDVLADSASALRVLRRSGDAIWEAPLRYNRGVVFIALGLPHKAAADLARAFALYSETGRLTAATDTRHHLLRLRLLEGDNLGCLAGLDGIAGTRLSGWAACWTALTRARALVGLQLLGEAREELGNFVNGAAEAGAQGSVLEARLDAARMSLLVGDAAAATVFAETAKRYFLSRQQRPLAAQATLLMLSASTLRGNVPSRLLRAGASATEVLAASGLRSQAIHGHLVVAQAAIVASSLSLAKRELALAAPLARSGTAADRVALQLVRGLLHGAEGNTARAERELREGLRLLDEYRSALGAIELRATVSGIGTELALGGLRIALRDGGDPAKTLLWAERLRGNALRLPPVRPAADRKLRAQQAELRRVTERIRETERRELPTHGLVVRQRGLENAIRQRSRFIRGAGDARRRELSIREMGAALEERILVEYVALDGALYAVTVAQGRVTLHELPPGDVAGELEWLRFALRGLARTGGDRAQRESSLASARAAAAALDRLLLVPLRPVLGEAPVVVVPTGELHALPWGSLPSLQQRPVVVAPSLTLWLDLSRQSRRRRRGAALIAGPRLRQASREVGELASQFEAPTVLRGKDATVGAALKALERATVAHVACHGRFRSDNPLFSALELADGPLTALDLQGLRRTPELIVLSACNLALSDRHPGDELLGLSATLLAMGTRTIVASALPVPDALTRRLMRAFHRELAAGAAPAAALMRARATLGETADAASFVCLGTG
jgi:tetratricopeptide (TPR) repeat protein